MTQSDQFVDEAIVTTFAGDGGNGLASFRRERFVPRGGPNGGDGGRGGNVVFVADRNLGTLRDQKYRREIRAASGEHGGTNNRFAPSYSGPLQVGFSDRNGVTKPRAANSRRLSLAAACLEDMGFLLI